MKVLYSSILALALLAFTLCRDEGFELDKNVIVLNSKNFDKGIEKFENVIVIFYNLKDEYCGRVFKSFEENVERFRKANLFLAKVNALKEKDLVKRYPFSYYPGIKYFRNKKVFNYDQPENPYQVIEWVMKLNGGIITNLENNIEMETFKNMREFSVVYFGTDKKDLDEFTKAAKKLKNYSFGTIKSDEGFNHYKDGTLVLFKELMNERLELTTIKEEEIIKFVKENTKPILMNFDGRTGYITVTRGKPGLFLLINDLDAQYNKLKEVMNKVMEKVSEKLQVIVTDIFGGVADKLGGMLNVKSREMPVVKIMDAKRNKRFKLEGEINEENVLKFVKNWEEGKIKQDFRNEREPRKNDGDVFIVVTSTFEKEVLDNDKDVMLLLYSSAKYDCRQFIKEKYDVLAKKLKDKNPNLRIAKIDLTLNEIESITVNIVPTLKFFPGNAKSEDPLDCESEKTIEQMIDFIKKNSFHKVVYEEEKTGDL